MWDSKDYIFLSGIIFPFVIVIIDLIFGVSQTITNRIRMLKAREDIIFVGALAYWVIILILEINMNVFAHFNALVDYTNVHTSILRYEVVSSIINFYLMMFILSPVICLFAAWLSESSMEKWVLYGLVMNIYGVIYLISLIIITKIRHNKSLKHGTPQSGAP